MIDAKEAERLARHAVRRLAGTEENDFSLQTQKTIEDANGWIFFYNSLRFIQTGDSINMLAGNGPIFISKSGKETILPSNIPWWEALSKLRDGR